MVKAEIIKWLVVVTVMHCLVLSFWCWILGTNLKHLGRKYMELERKVNKLRLAEVNQKRAENEKRSKEW